MIVNGVEICLTESIETLLEVQGEKIEIPKREKSDPTELLVSLIFEYEEMVTDYALAIRSGKRDGTDPLDVILDLIENDPVSRRINIEFKKQDLSLRNVRYDDVAEAILAA